MSCGILTMHYKEIGTTSFEVYPLYYYAEAI